MRRRVLEQVIVVIEDSDEDYEVTVWALQSAGVTNKLVRCATAADIDALLEDPAGRATTLGGSFPLLVLLDINVPGTDRHDTLQRLRGHPFWRCVPVIVISTSSHAIDVSVCYAHGAAGYLLKPLDLDAFAASIQRLAAYWLHTVVLPDHSDRPSARVLRTP
jgi:CheY-like chemotaxis protein